MKRSYGLVFCGVILALFALQGTAQAQATRTWVSGVGDDANPCSRTAPCKTWAGAISKTAAGGEMDALDPGGFGALTIVKAITIDGGGGMVASSLVSGTNGFVVAAGPNDMVVLRNLQFNGLAASGGAPSPTGISFSTGRSLEVDHCVISNFTTGLDFEPSTNAFLVVRDSVFENNSTGGLINATSSTTGKNWANISNSSFIFSGNGFGIESGANSRTEVFGSVLSMNKMYGAVATGVNASLELNGSSVSNNQAGGVHATNSGIARIANTMFAENSPVAFLSDSGGSIVSFGNNQAAGNVNTSSPTSTTPQI